MEFIFRVILYAADFYRYAVIIYVISTWIPDIRRTSFGRFLATICEPLLTPFRRIIPPIGGLDLSPLVAILTLLLATDGLRRIFAILL